MRGKQAKKREPKADSKYNSIVVSRFINIVMQDGKKNVATNIVHDALEKLEVKKTGSDKKVVSPLEIFETALENIKPKLEIRSRRVGGANYQVPVPVSPSRQEALAMRWLIAVARDSRKKLSFSDTLRQEIMAAYNNEGTAVKKKEDTQRMAEANKAFSQFA